MPDNNTVTIANPRPGGSRYTNQKRAYQFVKRGIAKMVNGTLVFYEDQRRIDERAQAAFNIAVGENRVIGWNGTDSRPFIRQIPGRNRS